MRRQSKRLAAKAVQAATAAPRDQTPVSISCGDFNVFASKLGPGMIRGLAGRMCERNGVDYVICYGGPDNTAHIRECTAEPGDRGFLMTEDQLGIAYGNPERRHRVGPDTSIPWPSNHPWLTANVRVQSGRKQFNLCVATWNVLVRGASRKGFGDADPHWNTESSKRLYGDIIEELTDRLALPAPYDAVCLQEAGPGQIRATAPDGSVYYYSVSGHQFSAATLTAGIRSVLQRRRGEGRGGREPAEAQFGVIALAGLRRALPRGLRSETTWVIARSEHGRMILVRLSAVNVATYKEKVCRARGGDWSERFKRQAHTICLPLLWRSPRSNETLTLDTHLTNFHSDWHGVPETYVLRSLGVTSARALVPAPHPRARSSSTRRTSSGARERRSRRRRWGYSSSSPRWSDTPTHRRLSSGGATRRTVALR